MYHPAKNFTIRLVLIFATASLVLSAQPERAFADPHPLTTAALSGNLSFVSSELPYLPVHKALKKKPLQAQVYEYDSKPLGARNPFLFVHGLRGEYYPTFRWNKVIKKFTSNPDFDNQYKVYLLRYDSVAPVEQVVPQFRNAIASLYHCAKQRPITLMALSIGGNMVYEGMLDKTTDSSIRLAFTLGTPFRGSPLFCEDWLQYSVYKNPAFPWTRIDHGISYKLYFHHNPNLQKDYRWDNADDSIPDVGHFSSLLPLGPKGDLTVARTMNNRLIEINNQQFDKKKLITYSGYLINPYMVPDRKKRRFEQTIEAPYTMLTIKIPSHFAREHPVLKMLNREIGSIVPSAAAVQKAGTPFLYQLNDGIAPVLSAVFLPSQACASVAMVKEDELPKLKGLTDVRVARVFRDVDHLTFIDGYRPLRASAQIQDELNPDAGKKRIFDWMLSDLLQFDHATNKIARE